MIRPRQPTRVPPGEEGVTARLARDGALAHLLLALRERVGVEQSHQVELPASGL